MADRIERIENHYPSIPGYLEQNHATRLGLNIVGAFVGALVTTYSGVVYLQTRGEEFAHATSQVVGNILPDPSNAHDLAAVAFWTGVGVFGAMCYAVRGSKRALEERRILASQTSRDLSTETHTNTPDVPVN